MKPNLLPVAAAIIFVFATSACGTSSDADASAEPETQLPAVTLDDEPEVDEEPDVDDGQSDDSVDSSDRTTPTPPKDPIDDIEDEPGVDDTVESEINLDEVAAAIEGLELSDASAWAGEHAMSVRVVQQDGEALMVTMDYSLSRINVAADGNVVTEVLNFG